MDLKQYYKSHQLLLVSVLTGPSSDSRTIYEPTDTSNG